MHKLDIQKNLIPNDYSIHRQAQFLMEKANENTLSGEAQAELLVKFHHVVGIIFGAIKNKKSKAAIYY